MADYRLLSAHGVRRVLGTDSPLAPVGLSLHLALRALHTHGYSPTEALHSATTVPARLFARDDLGTLQPGKRADLVVIDGYPFTDFTTLISTALTVHDGIVHQAEALVALRPHRSVPYDRSGCGAPSALRPRFAPIRALPLRRATQRPRPRRR
jgi:cytosine/adenosine deaminase-related metal-dependent hydrolase